MSDVSEFSRDLRHLIEIAQNDLEGIERASNNLIEVHKQMNTLRGLYDLVDREKANFVRDFQAKVAALRHVPDESFGGYNLEDSNDPMPRIMRTAQAIRQEYEANGYYGPEAAE
jgi:hypothetical protein